MVCTAGFLVLTIKALGSMLMMLSDPHTFHGSVCSNVKCTPALSKAAVNSSTKPSSDSLMQKCHCDPLSFMHKHESCGVKTGTMRVSRV